MGKNSPQKGQNMLIQMMPDKVQLLWEDIKDTVERSIKPIPGESENKLNNILVDILNGSLVCWIGYHEREGERTVNAIVLTKMFSDNITEVKSLLIYCGANIEGKSATFEDYQEAFIALQKYALYNGCSRITAYTDIDYMVEMAKKFGGVDSYTFLSFPI